MPSAEADGLTSPSRTIRNAFARPEQRGEERDEQRDLEGDRPRLGVDAQDLVLDLRGLAGEQLLELDVAHHLGVVLEHLRRPALAGPA